jgi:coenzyme Q-binding protein COQ10
VTKHSETRIVPYPADLMYAVVADVEAYPKFVPGVKALYIAGRSEEKGREILSARMTAGFANFSESYTSRVVLDPVARTIDVVQTDGPFRMLENRWRFTPQGEGCRIDFSIAFEFRNPILNMVAASAFGRVMLRMQDAFLERAGELSRKA